MLWLWHTSIRPSHGIHIPQYISSHSAAVPKLWVCQAAVHAVSVPPNSLSTVPVCRRKRERTMSTCSGCHIGPQLCCVLLRNAIHIRQLHVHCYTHGNQTHKTEVTIWQQSGQLIKQVSCNVGKERGGEWQVWPAAIAYTAHANTNTAWGIEVYTCTLYTNMTCTNIITNIVLAFLQPNRASIR